MNNIQMADTCNYLKGILNTGLFQLCISRMSTVEPAGESKYHGHCLSTSVAVESLPTATIKTSWSVSVVEYKTSFAIRPEWWARQYDLPGLT